MTRTRRRYTMAFKEKGVGLVVEEGYKISEATCKLASLYAARVVGCIILMMKPHKTSLST